MTQEILEGNKLILEFMEFPVNTKQVQFDSRIYYNVSSLNLPTGITIACEDQFDFNRSFDWLMPVVEKIEYDLKDTYCFDIKRYGVKVYHLGIKCYETIIYDKVLTDAGANSKIESVYIAVIEFIKWYNLCQKEK